MASTDILFRNCPSAYFLLIDNNAGIHLDCTHTHTQINLQMKGNFEFSQITILFRNSCLVNELVILFLLKNHLQGHIEASKFSVYRMLATITITKGSLE